MTAAHVMRGVAKDLERGRIGCLCIGVRSDGVFDAWKLRSLTYHDGDLAWLSLELCSAIDDDWGFSIVAVSTRAPKTGEKLTIVGFRFEAQVATTEESSELPPLAGRLIAAAGTVRAVFPHQRDAVVMPFPSIQMACGSASFSLRTSFHAVHPAGVANAPTAKRPR